MRVFLAISAFIAINVNLVIRGVPVNPENSTSGKKFIYFSKDISGIIGEHQKLFSLLVDDVKNLGTGYDKTILKTEDSELISALNSTYDHYRSFSVAVNSTCNLNKDNYNSYQNYKPTSDPSGFGKQVFWRSTFLKKMIKKVSTEVPKESKEINEVVRIITDAFNKIVTNLKEHFKHKVEAELEVLKDKIKNEEDAIEKSKSVWWKFQWGDRKTLEQAQKTKSELEEKVKVPNQFLQDFNIYVQWTDKVKTALNETVQNFNSLKEQSEILQNWMKDFEEKNLPEMTEDQTIINLNDKVKEIYKMSCSALKSSENEV